MDIMDLREKTESYMELLHEYETMIAVFDQKASWHLQSDEVWVESIKELGITTLPVDEDYVRPIIDAAIGSLHYKIGKLADELGIECEL